ncbi:CHRD domain-containing protein [Pontibacter korlensis]|uniref:CHRD domain-containing protein n=1 Tax=Pontibacter korlensis TaxID=400092 RepID=UPI000697C40F|nr:CHRD domain-containing protein [Pontibacter korlensis]
MEKTFTNYAKSLLVCLMVLGGLTVACDDDDDIDIVDEVEFVNVELLGANERPPVESSGSGEMDVVYNDATNMLTYTISWELGNPDDNTVAMHFHGPADVNSSAPPVIDITGFDTDNSGTVTGTTRALTDDEEADLKAGLWYVNIHSATHPSGELRGNLIED